MNFPVNESELFTALVSSVNNDGLFSVTFSSPINLLLGLKEQILDS